MQAAMRGDQRAAPRACAQITQAACTVSCPGLKLPAAIAAQR
jgi:hypothetical protein